MKKTLGILFVATLVFNGCGTDDDSVPSLTMIGASGSQVALNGGWSQGCVADLPDAASDEYVVTFSGSSFSFTHNGWSGSTDCSGTPTIILNVSGTATLGEEVTAIISGSPVTATKIDQVNNSALLTMNNIDVVSHYNSVGWCGATDWEIGIAKDVLGTDCVPVNSEKNIMYIEDTVDPDLMYSGIIASNGGALDANGYPTELDAEDPYMRL